MSSTIPNPNPTPSPNPNTTEPPPVLKLEPVQSSIILADLIPALLVLAYLAFGCWKVCFLLRKYYATGRGVRGWFGRRSRAKGRVKMGYVHVSGGTDGDYCHDEEGDVEMGLDENENGNKGKDEDEDESNSTEMQQPQQTILVPRPPPFWLYQNNAGLAPTGEDGNFNGDNHVPSPEDQASANHTLTPGPSHRRKRPPPLVLNPCPCIEDKTIHHDYYDYFYHPSCQPATSTSTAKPFNVSRFFDPETGRLKDYIIRHPATGLEALCGRERERGLVLVSEKECASVRVSIWMRMWTEGVVERVVVRAQGWFEGGSTRVRVAGEGGYRLVQGDDADENDETVSATGDEPGAHSI